MFCLAVAFALCKYVNETEFINIIKKKRELIDIKKELINLNIN